MRKSAAFIFFFTILIILAVFSFENKTSKPSATTPQPSTSPVPYVLGKRVGEDRLYPDPNISPGDVFSNVSEKDVCVKGYSSSVRNVSVATKKMVYQEYNISYPQPTGAFETDHFIPLELGGSNDIKNLWPEAADPKPGFHEKDLVENYLHSLVCSGKESLSQAQEEIRTDWYSVYLRIQNTSPTP